MGEDFVLGDVFTSFADNDAQLAFVVELVFLGEFGDGDVFVERGDGGAGFDED